MPTFSFSSGTGVSLSDRIAAINAKQRARMNDDADSLAEDSLIEQVNNEEEATDTFGAVKTTVREQQQDDTGSFLELSPTHKRIALYEISDAIRELTAEVRKMNKHINSISKSVKKS